MTDLEKIGMNILTALSPGELGILGVVCDDNDHIGDDDLYDALRAACENEDIGNDDQEQSFIAYAIAHTNGRTVEGL